MDALPDRLARLESEHARMQRQITKLERLVDLLLSNRKPVDAVGKIQHTEET